MTFSPLALRIAVEISQRLASGQVVAGAHLATEGLAAEFNVSRSPVREALSILQAKGIVARHANRGFFVRTDIEPAQVSLHPGEGIAPARDVYSVFAEDWLQDRIESEFTEQALRERYDLTAAQAQDMLLRAAREGWAEPKPGYGWRLREVAKTPEAFEQIHRFRLVIEPAAIMDPGFAFDRQAADALRRLQEKLAASRFVGLSPEAIGGSGPAFHEAVMRMSNNLMYVQALERANQLRRLLEYSMKLNFERIAQQSAEHLIILDILEKGDALEAAHLMRRHLQGALSAKAVRLHALPHK